MKDEIPEKILRSGTTGPLLKKIIDVHPDGGDRLIADVTTNHVAAK